MPGINGNQMVVTFQVAPGQNIQQGQIVSVTNENGDPDNGRAANSHRPSRPIREVFSTAALTKEGSDCFTFIYNGREYTVCV